MKSLLHNYMLDTRSAPANLAPHVPGHHQPAPWPAVKLPGTRQRNLTVIFGSVVYTVSTYLSVLGEFNRNIDLHYSNHTKLLQRLLRWMKACEDEGVGRDPVFWQRWRGMELRENFPHNHVASEILQQISNQLSGESRYSWQVCKYLKLRWQNWMNRHDIQAVMKCYRLILMSCTSIWGRRLSSQRDAAPNSREAGECVDARCDYLCRTVYSTYNCQY